MLPDELVDRLTAMMPREPNYRYWETSDGREFFYTTERTGAGDDATGGKYASGVNRPIKYRTAKSLEAALTRGETVMFERVDVSYHRLRKDAKRRAWRLYVAHVLRLVAKGKGSAREQARVAEWEASDTPPETLFDDKDKGKGVEGVHPAGVWVDEIDNMQETP